MKFFSTAARLRFSLWASLAAGLVGTGTVAPSPTQHASPALTSFDAPALDLCTETLFTGFPTIAAFTMPAVDEQLTSLACADGGCVDPESVSSQPSAGGNVDDMLPESGEEIPVLASLAPLPDVPGLGDPDITDEPQWVVGGQQSTGGGKSSGGANGGGGSEEFVLLPGTGGFNTAPANGGGDGANGGGEDTGNDSGGGTGGGGSGGGGFGSTDGGSRANGQGEEEGGEEKFPFQRLAAIGDSPAEVPAPATITLLGLGLVALAHSRR